MRKTALIALAVLLFPAALMARDIEMGKFEITGTTRFDMNWGTIETDNQEADTDTYSLDLDAQYYIIKNLAVGAFLSYEDVSIDGPAGQEADSTRWMIGPQVTYNISYDDKLSFFVNGGVAYADWEIGNADGDGWGVRVGGGAEYFLTQSVALVGQLRYDWMDLGNDIESDSVDLGFGLSVFF